MEEGIEHDSIRYFACEHDGRCGLLVNGGGGANMTQGDEHMELSSNLKDDKFNKRERPSSI